MKNYRKKNFVILSLVALFVLAFSVQTVRAQAPVSGTIQETIAALMAHIASLQSQLAAVRASTSGVGAVSTPPPTESTSLRRVCPPVDRTLAVGSTGSEVKSLQEYLRSEGLLSTEATGYYGSKTASAVAALQAQEGLSSVGIFGPQTRARIAARCVTPPTVPPVLPPTTSPLLVASPTNGNAPLTVTFSTWLSGFRVNTISYLLEYGDGESEVPTSCLAPADACIEAGKNTHVYKKNGTYTATLYQVTDICAGNPLCMAPIKREAVANATITVGGPVACTLEYNPVCGSKPIVCITTPCNPIEQTYGNRCALNADGATFLYAGECKAGTKNLPPVISSLSGPTTLAVGEKGTWTVKASDPEKGALTYSITWGDEVAVMNGGASGMAAPMRMNQQTTTFTHSYAKAGEYTVRIVVTDKEGGTAESSATVRVGKDTVACTKEYAPVCGQPPGCTNSCPPGLYCAMLCQMPAPVTYSNTCTLTAAGATKLYDGACNGSIYPSM